MRRSGFPLNYDLQILYRKRVTEETKIKYSLNPHKLLDIIKSFLKIANFSLVLFEFRFSEYDHI